MYKDIISYELSEQTTEEQLLKVAGEIIKTWMRKQPGFIKWEIHSNKNGSYTDIVHWKSEEDAKNSEKEMINIPNAAAWYACYKKGSIVSLNVQVVGSFE